MPSEIDNASFELFNKMILGQQEQQPRWKRAIGAVEGTIGELLGQSYVETYFPPENKAAMDDLVANLRKAGLKFDIMTTSFFLSRRSIRPAANSGMPLWQDKLFIGLAKSANDATDFFQIPTGRVVGADAMHVALRSILRQICEQTGMGFSAVARVTDTQWIACQVEDQIDFCLSPGEELKIRETICDEIRESGEAVVFDDASDDIKWSRHPVPVIYGFKSYCSFPVYLEDASFFGVDGISLPLVILTTAIMPPKMRNWLTWSTSEVTRETRAPRNRPRVRLLPAGVRAASSAYDRARARSPSCQAAAARFCRV